MSDQNEHEVGQVLGSVLGLRPGGKAHLELMQDLHQHFSENYLEQVEPLTVLIEEGSRLETVLVLVSGHALVLKKTASEESGQHPDQFRNEGLGLLGRFGRVIRRIKEGNVLLGEHSAWRGYPATATVVARTACRVLRIGKKTTLQLKNRFSWFEEERLQYFSRLFPEQVRTKSRINTCNTLKKFRNEELLPGSFLLREGEFPTTIYFIVSGQVLVIKHSKAAKREIKIADLGTGNVVGLQLLAKCEHSPYSYRVESLFKAFSLPVEAIKELPLDWRILLHSYARKNSSLLLTRNATFHSSIKAFRKLERQSEPRVQRPFRMTLLRPLKSPEQNLLQILSMIKDIDHLKSTSHKTVHVQFSRPRQRSLNPEQQLEINLRRFQSRARLHSQK